MSEIKTGRVISDVPMGMGRVPVRRFDVGQPLNVLFDETSVYPESPVFVVRPGEAVILSAYGLRERKGYAGRVEDHSGHIGPPDRIVAVIPAPEMVVVERLRFDASTMPDGDACCGGDFIIGQMTHLACVAQCGMWLLSPKQNVGVLSLPGTYRLRAVPPEAVGNFYVDAMRLPAEKLAYVPDDLWFGKVTAPDTTVMTKTFTKG